MAKVHVLDVADVETRQRLKKVAVLIARVRKAGLAVELELRPALTIVGRRDQAAVLHELSLVCAQAGGVVARTFIGADGESITFRFS